MFSFTAYGGEGGIWSFVSPSVRCRAADSFISFSPSIQIPLFKHATGIFKLLTIVFSLNPAVFGGERGI